MINFRRVLPHALCCALLAGAAAAHGQKPKKSAAAPAASAAVPKPAARPVLSFDEYEHLLNLLFPVDRSTPLGLDYTMVLRFESFHHPESQITLRHWHDGHTDAVLSRVASGNAWREAFGKEKPDHEPDFTAIVKAVEIKSYRVLIDSRQVQLWHTEMFPVMSKEFGHIRTVDKKIQRTGNTEVTAVGTRYELFFVQPDDEMDATSWDSEIEALPSGTNDLTKWMNTIRFYADNHIAGALTPAPAIRK